jgi:hypothetical protein
VVTDRERSLSEGADTFYMHGVFEAEAAGDLPLKSARPVAWVGADAIRAGRAEPGTGPADKVSPTVGHILQELDRL